MKNIYILYDEFLVDHAHFYGRERTIEFAKWYSRLRINEAVQTYRRLKFSGRQLQFDEADIRGEVSGVICRDCEDTGIIITGNNDLPCACPAGDRAVFNDCKYGRVTGKELKQRLRDQL